MKRTTVAAAVACMGIAMFISCAKKDATKEPSASGAATESAQEPAQQSAQEMPGRFVELPIDVMPKLVKADVQYPDEARKRGEQGIVYVRALVGKDGRVLEASVDPQKPASPLLAGAAVEAVKGWTFEPARAKGEPVEIWIVVPVNYKLH
jgi:periplasmic protein TonB